MEEFKGIVNNFINEEIAVKIKLNNKISTLIQAVCLCVVDGAEELSELISRNLEMKPLIYEALLQCTPYIGSPKVNKYMQMYGFEVSYNSKTIQQRFEEGKAKRGEIFGKEATENNINNTREDLKHIQHYLCSYCFGDFYTRDMLSVQERELLTFCILCSLGGCESQVKSHVQGNLNVGNTREYLIDAITLCLPYIGFPRTLNAISCINEITLR